MRSVESSKVAKAGQDLVGWILDHALGGIGKLSSASDLADEYRRKPYRSDAERVQALIRSAVAKNAATGFATGLGGVLTLPVAIPTSLVASLAIQARMVAAIAEIHGHDSKDDQVQTAILLCMLGTAMEDVGQAGGSHARREGRDRGAEEGARKGLDRDQQAHRFQAGDQVRREGGCELGEARAARRRGGRGNIRRGNLLYGRPSGRPGVPARHRRTRGGRRDVGEGA